MITNNNTKIKHCNLQKAVSIRAEQRLRVKERIMKFQINVRDRKKGMVHQNFER